MERTYSLIDIARHLDRPESTVRHWRDTFADFLPVHGSGRARRYPREAVAVFESIAAAYSEGLSTEAVQARLNATYEKTVTIDVSSPDRNENAMTPQAFAQGQEALIVFAFLERQRQALESARQEMDELRQALEETAAARDEAQRRAQAALDNAVVAKELAVKAQEELRQAQAESARREDELRWWIEQRIEETQRPRRWVDRLRRMLGR